MNKIGLALFFYFFSFYSPSAQSSVCGGLLSSTARKLQHLKDPAEAKVWLKKIFNRKVAEPFFAKTLNEESNLARQKAALGTLPKRNIENDPLISSYLRNHPVYLSLTTSPARINLLHHTLETLDLRLIKKIYISIPRIFERTGEEYTIPKSILENSKIEILRSEIDEGPAMKLLLAAEKLQAENPQATLITVDDDTGYPASLIQDLIFSASHQPDSAIGLVGRNAGFFNLATPPSLRLKVQNASFSDVTLEAVDLLSGYAGILYPAKIIPVQTIREWAQLSKSTFLSDDLVISYALEKANVTRYRMRSSRFSREDQVIPFQFGLRSDALHLGAGLEARIPGVAPNEQKYQQALDLLLPYIWGDDSISDFNCSTKPCK